MTVTRIAADEAIAALRQAAFVEPTENRAIVHCFLGSFGADWDLDGAIDLVGRADEIAWASSIFGQCLAVRADGKIYRFDGVRGP